MDKIVMAFAMQDFAVAITERGYVYRINFDRSTGEIAVVLWHKIILEP